MNETQEFYELQKQIREENEERKEKTRNDIFADVETKRTNLDNFLANYRG